MTRDRVSDELLARVVRVLADAVVVADPEGTITFWNAAAERLFGWTEAEAVGATLNLIIPPRLQQRHWDGYLRVMRTGRTRYGDRLLQVPALHRDGWTLSVAFTVSLVFDAGDGPPCAIVAVMRDDTKAWNERRRLSRELDELRTRLAGLGPGERDQDVHRGRGPRPEPS